MFVDLSELGPNSNDLEYNEDKLNSQTMYTEEEDFAGWESHRRYRER